MPATVAQGGSLLGGADDVCEKHHGEHAVGLVDRADAGEELGHLVNDDVGITMYFAPGIRSAM